MIGVKERGPNNSIEGLPRRTEVPLVKGKVGDLTRSHTKDLLFRLEQ